MKAKILSNGEDESQGQGCTGHGRCFVTAAHVYDVDEQGYNADAGKTIDIAPGDEDAARSGAEACPERAIIIEEG